MDPSVEDKIGLCPTIQRAWEILGKKWMGLIIHALAEGEKHFCELEAAVPLLSARMLAERVRELQVEGIVERRVHDGSPVRVSYLLTDKGRGLMPVLEALADWAYAWTGTTESFASNPEAPALEPAAQTHSDLDL